MTEAEWLVSDDSVRMLAWVRSDGSGPGQGMNRVPLSQRKVRLFACGSCRLVWDLLADQRSRRAVEATEAMADGRRAVGQDFSPGSSWWNSLWEGVWAVCQSLFSSEGTDSPAYLAAWHAAALLTADPAMTARPQFGRLAPPAALLRCIAGNPWCGWYVETGPDGYGRPSVRDPWGRAEILSAVESWRPKRNIIYRNWRTPTVLALASAAYEAGRPCGRCKGEGYVPQLTDRGEKYMELCPACHGAGSDGLLDPVRLSILADALEEAGCPMEVECRKCRGKGHFNKGDGESNTCEEEQREFRTGSVPCNGTGRIVHPLLAHLRGPGPHARGCWALDLILGKD
jgi:hypothetical protein